MRIESKPFELSPGFEAETKQITHAVVRLLTNLERELLEISVDVQATAKLKRKDSTASQQDAAILVAAMGLDEAALDPFIKSRIWQRLYDKEFFIASVSAFIFDDGVRIDDRDTIRRYCGMMIETDEDWITYQREELRRTHVQPRPKIKCPNCATEFERA